MDAKRAKIIRGVFRASRGRLMSEFRRDSQVWVMRQPQLRLSDMNPGAPVPETVTFERILFVHETNTSARVRRNLYGDGRKVPYRIVCEGLIVEAGEF